METMERRRLGRTGIAVSALGFGASEFGQKRTALKMAASILGSALDAGLNVIDTAACYGNSEELIGRAVGHRRKDFYILTKCGHASGLPFEDWTPALVEPSIDRSLKRLRTDYLDVVQLHSCDERQLRQGELIHELQRARDKGKLRYIGYSGDGDAALYAVQCNAFDTLQISLSIADQEAIETVLPLARERELGVIAKRPIANAAWLGGSWWSLSLYSRPYRMRLRKLNYEF
jgi:aryl-alcohol dehydrogenase-like predicted oxidoreductase